MSKWFRFTTVPLWEGFFVTTAEECPAPTDTPPLLLVCRLVKISPSMWSDGWEITANRVVEPGENPKIYYPDSLRAGWVGQGGYIEGTSQVYFTPVSGESASSTFVSIDGPNLEDVEVGDEAGWIYEGGNAIRFYEPIPVGSEYTVRIYGLGESGFWTRFVNTFERA